MVARQQQRPLHFEHGRLIDDDPVAEKRHCQPDDDFQQAVKHGVKLGIQLNVAMCEGNLLSKVNWSKGYIVNIVFEPHGHSRVERLYLRNYFKREHHF